MREEIGEKNSKLFLAAKPQDPTYEIRKYSLKNKKDEDLDAVNSMSGYKEKIGRKRTYNIEDKIENVLKSRTTNMLIDFDVEISASIKSFAIKKRNDQVRITTRFLSGKLLMFAKLSVISFIYELVETFYFPNETVNI